MSDWVSESVRHDLIHGDVGVEKGRSFRNPALHWPKKESASGTTPHIGGKRNRVSVRTPYMNWEDGRRQPVRHVWPRKCDVTVVPLPNDQSRDHAIAIPITIV